ncbi:hypothetical protein GCM10020254_28060 [Streptomyces goshikiensis]
MSQGQAADHEQAHAAGDGDVHGRRRREPLVDRGEVLGGEADTGVVDLDEHAAVGERVTGDLDLGLRGGERGGVLQQLGEEVHEVVDDAAGDVGAGHRREFDALVLLHLGRRGAEHVDERDGAGPPAARLLAREDEEVFAVTAHAGREVVELEERGQLVRVGLAGLQLRDERELTLDEALGTAREVGEHRVDVAPEEGLLGGEADGLAVHVVEGRGHLADLVAGVHADRLHGRVHVLRVGLGELLDELGQTVLGDARRGVLEAAQRADHRPGHDEGADEGDTEDEEDQGTVDDGVLLGLVLQLTGLLLHVFEQGELDDLHGLELVVVGVVPVEPGAVLLLAELTLGAQDAAGVVVGGADLRVAVAERREEFLGLALVDEFEGLLGLALTTERGEGVQPVVLLQPAGLVRDRRVRERGGDDRALDGGVLLGGGERRQGTGTLDHLGVGGGLGHVLREGEQRDDQRVVLGDGLLGAVLVRLLADVLDAGELAADLQDVVADRLERLVLVLGAVDLVGRGGEGLGCRVRLVADALDDAVDPARLVGRQRTRGVVALGLEHGGQVGGLPGHRRQELHVLQLRDVVERVVDAEATERGGRDDGQGQQRHQSRADAPVLHGETGTGSAGDLRYRHVQLGGLVLDLALVAALGQALGLGAGLAATLGLHRGGGVGARSVCSRPAVLGVLGRGATVGPAARLLLRRSAAIPLESSLH